MGRELRKELKQARERLRRLKDEGAEIKNPHQRRENADDQQLMSKIIMMTEVRLGLKPSRRYGKTRRK